MDPLRGEIIREIIGWLGLPAGSRGLDIACGIGLEAARLAEAVAPAGSVVGTDLSTELMLAGRERLPAAAVEFAAADWSALPFSRASFDWVWSCDGVGYAPFTQERALAEIARVLKPGGRVALSFWSSQTLLPGYPRLEARLNATRAGLAPFEEGLPPALHAMRGLGWMRAAGLVDVRAKSFIRTVQAPLDEPLMAALTDLLDMRWGGCEGELSPADRGEYLRLCRPDSGDFILRDPDYCAFFTYTVFYCRAAGGRNAV